MRWLISFAVAAIAVIVQLTIVDRITFPGGTGPDVVLLAVAALALAGGPLAGALIGFSAGLALDVAPPGSHFAGQNALVFCLVGYACGLVAEEPSGDGVPEQGHTALFEIAVTAAGAVCGEVLASLLGTMLSDPRVTWPAVKHVLPVALVYDVLLAPFVLYAVAAVLRLAGAPKGARGDWSPQSRAVPGGRPPGLAPQVGTPNPPRLRLSDPGKREGWIGGLRGQGTNGRPPAKREPRLNLGRGGSLAGSALSVRTPAKREPRLNLGRGGPQAGSALSVRTPAKREPRLNLGRGGPQAGSALSVRTPAKREPRLNLGRGGPLAGSALGAAFAPGGGSVKVRFGTRRGGGVLGGSLLGSALTGTSSLRSTRFGRSRMGRSLLGGSVFSRSPSALGRPAPAGPSVAFGRSSPFGGSSFLGRSSLPGRSSFLGRSSTFGRSAASRRAGRMRPAPGGTATGRVPRFSRGSTFTRLTAALRGSKGSGRSKTALGRSPGRGWLRRTPRGGMGRGWTGGSAPQRRIGPARLHMPRPRAKRKWRTGGYR